MTDTKTLRLLLVEDDLEDEQLLCEALIEIEENRQWCNWRDSSIVHVDQLSDALNCLRRDSFDAVLLNLSLPDSPVLLDSFLEANVLSCGAPIIVLADEDDENLANRLLREGAQDVVLKTELECKSLARSLRYAIERQRRNASIRSLPFVDELTGAFTRQGFLTMAGHYAQLSRQAGETFLLASIELGNLEEKTQEDRQARELLLLRAAEILRGAFVSPSLIGRVGRCRFGLIAVAWTETALQTLLNRVAGQIEDAALVCGARARATVRFCVSELDPEGCPEDFIDEGGEESTAASRRRMKTVMLAD